MRVNMDLETSVPIWGIDLKIIYSSDSLRPRGSFWINYENFGNWMTVEYVNGDTDHVALLSKTPFQGKAKLGSFRVFLARYVTPGKVFRLDVRAIFNDTIAASYVGGNITAGPVINLFGDMNRDGRYAVGDAKAILDIAIPDSILNISLEDSLRADVNGDQIIDTYDSWSDLYKVVNPYFRFEVEDFWGSVGGSGSGGGPKGQANLMLEETSEGVYVSLGKNSFKIFNGDLSFVAPATSVEVKDPLNRSLYKTVMGGDGRTRIGFLATEEIPSGERLMFLRGVRASDLKVEGRVNNGISITPIITRVTTVGNSDRQPITFALSQNYPNPFNPSTKISYDLPNNSFVTLKIFNVMGEEVATLVSSEQSAGNHSVSFDGNQLSSGVYYYRIEAGTFNAVKKMVLLK